MKTKIEWNVELPKMVKMIEGGKTIRELAEIYGTSFQNISYGFERGGIRLKDVSKERQTRKRQKKEQRRILADARREIKKRDEFYKKWSDISSYKAPKRSYNDSRILKDDPKSIANRKRQEAYREEHFNKVLARRVVSYAIKRGYLIHSMCNCGCGTIGTEFHHYNGYNRALDVICLCKKAHAEIHSGNSWKADRNLEVTHA